MHLRLNFILRDFYIQGLYSICSTDNSLRRHGQTFALLHFRQLHGYRKLPEIGRFVANMG